MVAQHKNRGTVNAEDSRAAWFVVLEMARARNDGREVEEALRQLRRLGVEVKYQHADPELVHA